MEALDTLVKCYGGHGDTLDAILASGMLVGCDAVKWRIMMGFDRYAILSWCGCDMQDFCWILRCIQDGI